MTENHRERLRQLYQRLHASYGEQRWWPAETPFEMIVGAYLTQNTSWRNVEQALANLRAAGRLSLAGMRGLSVEELESLVRPSGFFRQKAARLKAFATLVDARFAGELAMLLSLPKMQLRETLLALPGVGRETADSIVLYAAHQPIFIVDLYTRRLFARERVFCRVRGFDPLLVAYDDLRLRVEQAFEEATQDEAELTRIYNQFHALIVADGKQRRRASS